MTPSEPPRSELVVYKTEDGRTRIECRFEGDAIWLTQVQPAELFETSVPTINIHLIDICDDGQLAEWATIKPYLMVRAEGDLSVSRPVLHRTTRLEETAGKTKGIASRAYGEEALGAVPRNLGAVA